MREPPPAQLTALLTQLGLATARDLESVEAAVHRMAGNLPHFESVWIDVLRQARVLTPYQTVEILAGRGEALKVARYVVCHSVQECGYTSIFRAEDPQTREAVRLALFSPPDCDQDLLLSKLDKLIVASKSLASSAGVIEAAGHEGQQFWASSPWVEGVSLADFMLHHGRFPAEAVLEIARAMLSELVGLETANLIHGDIRVENVIIAGDGAIHLPHPGLRGLIRPHEGISHHDLAPETCSTLAPERVTDGMLPTVSSDLFACGCVWWHMLCGRPPLGCGDTMARLRAAQAAAIEDLHQWAANVPEVLVEAVSACLQKDPRKRPQSMAELAQRLGPLRRHGRQAIARCLVAKARPLAPWLRSKRAAGKKVAHPHRFTAAALIVLTAVAVAWPIWVARNKPRGNPDIASHSGPADAKPQSSRNGAAVEKARAELAPQPMIDKAVTPAAYADSIGQPRSSANNGGGDQVGGQIGNSSSGPGNELRLPCDRPVRGELLQLSSGQRVRAQSGRARIVVPHEGIAVQANRVSFENIDFVPEGRSNARTIADRAPGAIIRLLAAECDFLGCSFQSAGGAPELSAAIVWQHASSQPMAAFSLPSGRIRLQNCVFRRMRVGIESQMRGAIGLEIVNALYLGPGPMIRLTHAPAADEPLRVNLSQVTLREADALIDCHCVGSDDRSGEINIEASGCVLALRGQAALLTLASDTYPRSLLHELKWTGQGSVVAGQVDFGQWRRGDRAVQTIDDSTVSISGLVRGEVAFSGKFDGNPVSSQVINCQAPLRDTDAAGAAVRDLPAEVEIGDKR